MKRSTTMLVLSVLALGAGASLVGACGGLFGIIACNSDETCPPDLVCVAERCVDPGSAGEGEGEGEGEGPVLLTSTFRVDPCLAERRLGRTFDPNIYNFTRDHGGRVVNWFDPM